jgi:hypothetical protein
MSTENKTKSEIYKSNVIQFPNVQKNQALDEHEKIIANLAFTVQQKMDSSSWSKLPLIDDEVKMLSNYGETIKFAPDISARLIAVLATQLIRNSFMEDLL